MLLFRILIIICLLASNLFSEDEAPTTEYIQLGFASIEVVAVKSNGESQHKAGIVVKISGTTNNVQSYGLSIDPGLIVMPLPPGKYYYDAFSNDGEKLQLRRESSKRYFSINKGETTIVGIEILIDAKPINGNTP